MLLTRNRFITEQDTPSSYGGQTGLFTRVNAAEDALEFAAVGGGGSDISCRVFHSVNQSVPNVTPTVLAMDSEAFDTDGMHDPIINNSRITIQTAGKYLCYVLITYAANATGIRECQLRLNGSPKAFTDQTSVSVSGAGTPHLVTVLDLIVGDYIEAWAYQSSGGALNVGAGDVGGGIGLGASKIDRGG